MLTAAQHCDPWRHIQVQGRFERVAGCCKHATDQKQEPRRKGSSSLHLRRVSHGTRSLLTRAHRHAEALTPTCSACNSHAPTQSPVGKQAASDGTVE